MFHIRPLELSCAETVLYLILISRFMLECPPESGVRKVSQMEVLVPREYGGKSEFLLRADLSKTHY